MEYEICYLIGESKEADLDKIRPGVEEIIKKHKGTFLEGEYVKKRRLAYEIKREARGTYVARRFTIPSKDERDELYPDYDIMGEINKELRFNQDILRYMVVKTDDLPPLKDLEIAEEKARGQVNPRDNRRESSAPRGASVAPVKVAPVKEEKIVEKIAEEKKEEPVVKEIKEKKVEKEIVSEEAVEKPKKVSKKKEKEEGILGDDIDEKLDEILNI